MNYKNITKIIILLLLSNFWESWEFTLLSGSKNKNMRIPCAHLRAWGSYEHSSIMIEAITPGRRYEAHINKLHVLKRK